MSTTPVLTPFRPHLLRAFYNWIVENSLTPYLVVNAEYPGVKVPRQYVKDGQIVLNIAMHAVGHLELGDADVRFTARFGGVPFAVYVPMGAATAIYARENGAVGIAFTEEASLDAPAVPSPPPEGDAPTDEPKGDAPAKVSHLKIIK